MKLNIPTLAEADALGLNRPKPKYEIPTRKVEKAKAERVEKKVKTDVRSKCVARDGDCRIGNGAVGIVDQIVGEIGECDGPSEWAHLEEKKRSKTRGQEPEVRHTTAGSCILCRRHHNRYDGRERPAIAVAKLTKRGADGPLRWTKRTPKK